MDASCVLIAPTLYDTYKTTIAAIAEAIWFKTLSDIHNTFGVISNEFRLVLFIHGPQISLEKGARIINIKCLFLFHTAKYDRDGENMPKWLKLKFSVVILAIVVVVRRKKNRSSPVFDPYRIRNFEFLT